MNLRQIFLLLITIHSSLFTTQAQCINSFPYNEDFESGDGNWFSGGISSDWAWGAVSKTVIAQAASGSNCWVTGGLTASFYNLGERSYAQSPCFDFTTLQCPYITFDIYWETEKTYDGAVFQYSTDGGNTWLNTGSANDPTDCLNTNWFNSSSITNISGLASPQHGWSGNIQATSGSCQGGSGSNGWKTAKHCMPYLAGLPNVSFRFAFGAGTTCNDYDGFAFDDVFISDAPAPVIDFTSQCNGNSVSFTGTYTLCPTSFTWDFGDGTTGTGITTTHTYSTTGNYSVTFSANGSCSPHTNISKQIQMIGATASSVPVTCNGANNGNAFVTPTGGSGYSYVWNTTPTQTTDTAFNLPAGNYTVTVSAPNFCDVTATATISEPAPIANTFSIIADTCHASVGGITSIPTGGNAPYQFLWSTGSPANPLTNLAEGNYTVTITDAGNCSVSAEVFVPYASGISILLNPENVSCYGTNDGQIAATVTGGQQPYMYAWSNAANTTSINHLSQGVYVLTVTDANNCSAQDSLTLAKEVCTSYLYFPTAFSPNSDGANDLFHPIFSPDLKKYTLRIYNRWGEEVFSSSDASEGWDGTFKRVQQPLSTYVWFAEYSFTDGKKHSDAGNITLLK